MINLFITFGSSTRFRLQQPIFGSVLMLYVAIWYVSICPDVMRVMEKLQFLCCMLQFGMFFLHPHNNRTYRNIPNCNIQHKDAPKDGLLKSETC